MASDDDDGEEDELQRWCWLFVRAAESSDDSGLSEERKHSVSTHLQDLCHWVYDQFVIPAQSQPGPCDIAHIVHSYLSTVNRSGPFRGSERDYVSLLKSEEKKRLFQREWKRTNRRSKSSRRRKRSKSVVGASETRIVSSRSTVATQQGRRRKSTKRSSSKGKKSKDAKKRTPSIPKSRATSARRKSAVPMTARRGVATKRRNKSPVKRSKTPRQRHSKPAVVPPSPKSRKRDGDGEQQSGQTKLDYLRNLPFYGRPKNRKVRRRRSVAVMSSSSLSNTKANASSKDDGGVPKVNIDKDNPFFNRLLNGSPKKEVSTKRSGKQKKAALAKSVSPEPPQPHEPNKESSASSSSTTTTTATLTNRKMPVLPQAALHTSRESGDMDEMDAPEMSVLDEEVVKKKPPPLAASRRLRRRKSMPNLGAMLVAAAAANASAKDAANKEENSIDAEIQRAAKEAARRASMVKWKKEQERLNKKLARREEEKRIRANREKFESERLERLRELKQQNKERREKEALVDFMLQIPCVYMSSESAARSNDRKTRDIRWLLEKLQVTHRVVDISMQPEERDHVYEQAGKAELPVVFVNDEYRGGWEELSRANEENRLYALLDPFSSFDVHTFMKFRNIKAVEAKARKTGHMPRSPTSRNGGANRFRADGTHEGPYNPLKPNVSRKAFERIKQDPSWSNVFFGSSAKLRRTRSMSVVVSKDEMQKYMYKMHRGLSVERDLESMTTIG